MLDALHRASDLTISGGDYYGSGREQIGHRTLLVDHSWSLEPSVEQPAEPGRERVVGAQ
jgi:hypothetical protein